MQANLFGRETAIPKMYAGGIKTTTKTDSGEVIGSTWVRRKSQTKN
jgi:hypothetical protein